MTKSYAECLDLSLSLLNCLPAVNGFLKRNAVDCVIRCYLKLNKITPVLYYLKEHCEASKSYEEYLGHLFLRRKCMANNSNFGALQHVQLLQRILLVLPPIPFNDKIEPVSTKSGPFAHSQIWHELTLILSAIRDAPLHYYPRWFKLLANIYNLVIDPRDCNVCDLSSEFGYLSEAQFFKCKKLVQFFLANKVSENQDSFSKSQIKLPFFPSQRKCCCDVDFDEEIAQAFYENFLSPFKDIFSPSG